jgi:hypothetical protein
LAGDGSGLATLLLATVAGVLAADLASGVLHFACDTFFDERTPFIGAWLIAPFRDHHVDPRGIARHGFRERNGNNAAGTLPLLAGTLSLSDALGAFVLAFVLVVSLALAATNQIHAWAHAERCPTVVRALQRVGLLLRPSAHAAHHRGAHDRAFCITTGWLNPWLDRCDAFPQLRRGLRTLSGSRYRDPGRT